MPMVPFVIKAEFRQQVQCLIIGQEGNPEKQFSSTEMIECPFDSQMQQVRARRKQKEESKT
jgi:hypothetical protein